MKFRRTITALSALAIGAAGLMLPAGADAKIARRRVSAAPTWRLNGAESNMPVYVSCAPGAKTGTPTGRNLLTTKARGNIRMTIQFLNDPRNKIVLWGSHRQHLSRSLNLPCTGTGMIHYRVDRITKVRVRPRRALGRTAFVTAMVRLPVLHAATRNRTQLIEQSNVPFIVVGPAS